MTINNNIVLKTTKRDKTDSGQQHKYKYKKY